MIQGAAASEASMPPAAAPRIGCVSCVTNFVRLYREPPRSVTVRGTVTMPVGPGLKVRLRHSDSSCNYFITVTA